MLISEKGLFKLKRFMLDQAVEKIAAETMETCEERDKLSYALSRVKNDYKMHHSWDYNDKAKITFRVIHGPILGLYKQRYKAHTKPKGKKRYRDEISAYEQRVIDLGRRRAAKTFKVWQSTRHKEEGQWVPSKRQRS